MNRELLDQFEGKKNVIKIISDKGTVTYLTQSRSFDDETSAIGATKLNTIDNEKKHILFLFDSNDNEVGRYYLGKHLHGKTPSELLELKDNLAFFESFNPETRKWVPCVGLLANNPLKDIASKSISLTNSQNNKQDTVKDNLSSVVSEEDLTNAYKDEYGVMYSADGKRLLRITDELSSYSIRNGTKVICDGAFNLAEDEDSYVLSYNDALESIIIPDSVCQIGNNAFRNCVTLSKVVLSDTIKKIGDYAFCGCKALAAIHLPETLCEMGEAAFYGCEALSSFQIPNSISKLSNSVFSECAFSQISIPDSIQVIEDYAFYQCSNLKKVKMPKSVVKFGVGVFGGCPLMQFNIPESLTEIGFEFFSGSAFDQITIPNWVTKIGARAFCNSRLTHITIPNSVIAIGESAFRDSSLAEITIPDSVTEIADSTFEGCSLKKISIPNSVVKMGNGVFRYCQILEEITIPESVSEIGYGAFMYCQFLVQVTFSGIVSQIGDGIFEGCDALRKIIIPSGSKKHYERLLPEYRDMFVEQFCEQSVKEFSKKNGETIPSQVYGHFENTINKNVSTTRHLLLLQQLVNNSLYCYKHPTDTSNLPTFMWNDEGLFMGDNVMLPYTIPFLWIRTIAKRDVEKFDEVIDLLKDEFGVDVSGSIDTANLIQGIRQYGLSEFQPNFNANVNKTLLLTLYGDVIGLNNFVLFFGSNIDMSALLPSQTGIVNIPSASFSLNNVINEMIDDFRKGNIESK